MSKGWQHVAEGSGPGNRRPQRRLPERSRKGLQQGNGPRHAFEGTSCKEDTPPPPRVQPRNPPPPYSNNTPPLYLAKSQRRQRGLQKVNSFSAHVCVPLWHVVWLLWVVIASVAVILIPIPIPIPILIAILIIRCLQALIDMDHGSHGVSCSMAVECQLWCPSSALHCKCRFQDPPQPAF